MIFKVGVGHCILINVSFTLACYLSATLCIFIAWKVTEILNFLLLLIGPLIFLNHKITILESLSVNTLPINSW